MAQDLRIRVPQRELEEFCRRHHFRKLAFFGSVVRDDFTPASDVDVLVEFTEGKGPGLFGLTAMERELSHLLGRPADLNTKGSLSPYFVDEVLREARTQYVEA